MPHHELYGDEKVAVAGIRVPCWKLFRDWSRRSPIGKKIFKMDPRFRDCRRIVLLRHPELAKNL
jgi:hypothetical protein